MRLLCQTEVLKLLCKSTKKWGILVNFPENVWYSNLSFDSFWEYFKKAAPWFDTDKDIQAWADGFGIFLFNSKKEMERTYNSTVGDDGPTKLNKYKGPVRVYCLTCDNKGNLLKNNT